MTNPGYASASKRPGMLCDRRLAHVRSASRRLSNGSDGSRNGVGSARELRVGPMPPFTETNIAVVPNELIRYRITTVLAREVSRAMRALAEAGSAR